MTHWKGAIVKPDAHGTRRRVIYVAGDATVVCARTDLGTSRVYTTVDRVGARAVLYARCDVGDFTSLNRFVESVLPSLGYLTRIRSPGRIRGSPGRATYLWKTRRGGCTLTLEEGMGSVIVVLIPTFGKNASSDVVMARRDGAGMDGGGKGEDARDDDRDDASTSKRGGHDAGGEVACKGAMTSEDHHFIGAFF